MLMSVSVILLSVNNNAIILLEVITVPVMKAILLKMITIVVLILMSVAMKRLGVNKNVLILMGAITVTVVKAMILMKITTIA